jgi:hypothetical protein
MDVEQVIAGLEDLDRAELERLEEALECRLRELRQESPAVSGVLEYRPHGDGTLQGRFAGTFARTGVRRSKDPTGTSASTRTASRRSFT